MVTAIILAGRVGSAFAAELGTMQVGTEGRPADRRRDLGRRARPSEQRPALPSRAPPKKGQSASRLPASRVQVSEQMDSLRVLDTDPVDYLVTPRVLACMIAGPILNVLCFCMGEGC